MISQVIFYAMEVINMYFAGHLNDTAMLAGIGLGNMSFNLFAMSFAESFNSSIDVLGSQAYGAGNLRLCGIYLNRGRLISMLIMAPCLLVLMNIKHFYLAMGQDKAAVDNMQLYLETLIPAMIILAFNDL